MWPGKSATFSSYCVNTSMSADAILKSALTADLKMPHAYLYQIL